MAFYSLIPCTETRVYNNALINYIRNGNLSYPLCLSLILLFFVFCTYSHFFSTTMMVYNQLFLYRYYYVVAKQKRTKTVTMFLTYFQQHTKTLFFHNFEQHGRQ